MNWVDANNKCAAGILRKVTNTRDRVHHLSLRAAAAGLVFQANLACNRFHPVVQGVAAVSEFPIAIKVLVGHVLGGAAMLRQQGIDLFGQSLIFQHEAAILFDPLHLVRIGDAGLRLAGHESVYSLRSAGMGSAAGRVSVAAGGGASGVAGGSRSLRFSQISATT